MSNALKCPSSSCPYLFDPSRVPVGVVLTCPRCGMRFTLGPPVPPEPPHAHGGAPPTTDPSFSAMSSPAPEPTNERRPPRRSLSAAGSSGPLQTVILVFVVLALMGGVGAMVYVKLAHKSKSKSDTARLQEHNLALEPVDKPWVQDDDVRAKLGPPMILAFRRGEPDAFVAFGARDFATRDPRLGELRETLTRTLEHTFEDVTTFKDLPDAKWLGRPAAVAFKFEARTKEGPTVVGLCYALSHKGIGYWSISWAGEKDAAGQEAAFADVRSKLKLDNLRDNWTARELPVRPFGGHALGYQVLDGEDVWREPDAKEHPAAGADPKGDLLLHAKIKRPGRDVPESAVLVAAILKSGGGDPLAEGRKYIEDQRTAEAKLAGDEFAPSFTERKDPPDGDPLSNAIETPAPTVRLRMSVPKAASSSKLLVISAIQIGDKVVVAYGSCAWSDREAFEARLMQIVGSLREAK